MKRFYTEVSVNQDGDGFSLFLDHKPVKTPAGVPLNLPVKGLAEAVAGEWQGQGETIKPDTMPFTRLSNAVIDGVRPRRQAVIDGLVTFGSSDLLCYRAEEPPELVDRQKTQWQPILDWAAEQFGVRLKVVAGITPVDQPPAALEALRSVFRATDDFTLACAHNAASLCGSALLALALVHERLDLDRAWAASRVDEDWQVEQWGEDAEAAARDQVRRRELAVSVETMAHLRQSV